MSGTKGHSGRRRRATAQRNGRVYVALDMAWTVTVDGVIFSTPNKKVWDINGKRFTDYAAAAAEFVRRVNG